MRAGRRKEEGRKEDAVDRTTEVTRGGGGGGHLRNCRDTRCGTPLECVISGGSANLISSAEF